MGIWALDGNAYFRPNAYSVFGFTALGGNAYFRPTLENQPDVGKIRLFGMNPDPAATPERQKRNACVDYLSGTPKDPTMTN